jgi:hypothetical protein
MRPETMTIDGVVGLAAAGAVLAIFAATSLLR